MKIFQSISPLSIAIVLVVAVTTPTVGASLEYFANQADSVVVGSLHSRVEGPKDVKFRLGVERVLGGENPGLSVDINYSWAGLLRWPAVIEQDIIGIWFLKREASDRWAVIASRPTGHRTIRGLYLPASPMKPSGEFAYPGDASLVEVLIYEVTAGARIEPGGSKSLLGAFEGVRSPAVDSMFEILVQSGDISERTVGVTGLLYRSSPQAIEYLAELWPSIAGSEHSRQLLAALESSWRSSLPSSVQALGNLVQNAAVGSTLRRAGLNALASIHSQDALPFLATFLDSPVVEEQAQAVYGLSSFANGCPMKTGESIVSMAYLQCDKPTHYKTSETVANFAFRAGSPEEMTPLVTFWRDWWSEYQALH